MSFCIISLQRKEKIRCIIVISLAAQLELGEGAKRSENPV